MPQLTLLAIWRLIVTGAEIAIKCLCSWRFIPAGITVLRAAAPLYPTSSGFCHAARCRHGWCCSPWHHAYACSQHSWRIAGIKQSP
ncbi:hypothetical protein KCP75_25535 [Salmonella enterica subsp. enterica]|nr:hypothetical protein KCP75_25535 [Salmonella enterica subsp. enterica]